MSTPILEIRDASISFGAVRALSRVNLKLHRGEVLALVGDNGAGKSTLIKAISGIRPPDSGQIFVDGIQADLNSPRIASNLGIATVHQDLALCDELDVVGNLFLGRERRSRNGLWSLDEDVMETEASRLLDSLNATTIGSLRAKVARMSGGQRQSIAVARALIGRPQVVLLDEPTAALGVAQTHEVLELVRRLKSQNLGVIMISHNMSDVLAVSDSVQVLRLGKVNGLFNSRETTAEQIIAAITGATQSDPHARVCSN